MITVEGQYIFDIEVGKYKDFLESRDLVEFTLIEEAGNSLPSFDLKFRFSIPELRNYLIENNIVKITIGSSDTNKVTIPLRIFKKDLQNMGQNKFYVDISGYYDALGYMKGSHTTSVKSSAGEATHGLDAITQIGSKFFNVETNIKPENIVTEDNMRWLCARQSYRDFVTNIWYRTGLTDGTSDAKQTIPLMAITKNGVMRILNSSDQIKTKPKYRLSNRPPSAPNDIQINGKPEVTNDAGLTNSLVQNRVNRVQDMVNGGYREVKFTQTPVIAMTSDLDSFKTERKDGFDYLINNNVFTKYWDNYLHNISSLVHLSTARITVSFIGQYIEDMHVLDMVEYLEGKENNLNETEGLYSGRYLISKVVRTISEDKNFQTHLVLTRESFNDIVDIAREIATVALGVEENNSYTEAINKLNNIKSLIKSLLDLKSLKLNLPSIKLLAQELEETTTALFGYDASGIWIKTEHVLNSLEENLVFNILQQTFSYLSERQETVALPETSPILIDLGSGSYNDYMQYSQLILPNIGNTAITPLEYTGSIFGWYVQDKLTVDVQTGNTNLDGLLVDSINYLNTTGIVNQQDSTIFRRFWGSYDDLTINEDQLKQLYSDKSLRRNLHKIFVAKGYIYISYPYYVDLGTIRVEGIDYPVYNQGDTITNVNSFTVYHKTIKIDGTYQDYLIYQSNIKFSNKITLEVL